MTCKEGRWRAKANRGGGVRSGGRAVGSGREVLPGSPGMEEKALTRNMPLGCHPEPPRCAARRRGASRGLP